MLEEFKLLYYQNGTINPHYRAIQKRYEKNFEVSLLPMSLRNCKATEVYNKTVHRQILQYCHSGFHCYLNRWNLGCWLWGVPIRMFHWVLVTVFKDLWPAMDQSFPEVRVSPAWPIPGGGLASQALRSCLCCPAGSLPGQSVPVLGCEPGEQRELCVWWHSAVPGHSSFPNSRWNGYWSWKAFFAEVSHEHSAAFISLLHALFQGGDTAMDVWCPAKRKKSFATVRAHTFSPIQIVS